MMLCSQFVLICRSDIREEGERIERRGDVEGKERSWRSACAWKRVCK